MDQSQDISKDDKIDELLHNCYSTISLGYAGLIQMCIIYVRCFTILLKMGEKFALAIMNKLKTTCDKWKNDTVLD